MENVIKIRRKKAPLGEAFRQFAFYFTVAFGAVLGINSFFLLLNFNWLYLAVIGVMVLYSILFYFNTVLWSYYKTRERTKGFNGPPRLDGPQVRIALALRKAHKALVFFLSIIVGGIVILVFSQKALFVVEGEVAKEIPHQYSHEGFYLMEFLLKNNFILSLIFVLALLQLTLRKKFLKKQTWKKISDSWLKWSGVSALSVGGFGLIAKNKEIAGNLLKITSNSEFVNMNLLTTIYILVILFFGLAHLLTQIGKANSDLEESSTPLALFIPAFILTWLSNLGSYSLFINGIILTLHAHLNSF